MINSRFIHIGYVDSIQYQGFDSKEPMAILKPRAAWMEQELPKYWNVETTKILLLSQIERRILYFMIEKYEHRMNGESPQLRGHDKSMSSWSDPNKLHSRSPKSEMHP
jgi:major histocompatibility complex class I